MDDNDGNTGNEATSPSLTITITDVNDNAPVFTQNAYTKTTGVKFAQGMYVFSTYFITKTSLFKYTENFAIKK